MCYDEENRERPLGVNEAEAAWLEQMTKYRTAANNDIYTNGGLLDNTTKFGYNQPQMYGSNQIAKQVIETEFTYEELAFISRCRLTSMTIPEIDRLMGLIKKFKEKLIATQTHQSFQPNYQYNPYQSTPYFNPSYFSAGNAWLNNGIKPITDVTDERVAPRRGRRPKKKEDVEETTATSVETETTSDEHNDQVDTLTESEKSMFAKINNDSI